MGGRRMAWKRTLQTCTALASRKATEGFAEEQNGSVMSMGFRNTATAGVVRAVRNVGAAEAPIATASCVRLLYALAEEHRWNALATPVLRLVRGLFATLPDSKVVEDLHNAIRPRSYRSGSPQRQQPSADPAG